MEIEITVGDARVTMHACTICELRWWDSDGEKVDLDEVLGLLKA